MGKEEYYQLVYSAMATLPGLEVLSHDENIIFLPPAVLKPRKLWTGKQVVSTLLQNLRHSSYKDVKKSKGPLPGISMARKTKTPATAFGESMMEHQVLIRDGFLLRGVLDKAAFGATDMSLVHAVHEAYGPHKAGLLLNSLGRLFTAYIQYYAGHSCRMEDLVLKRDADRDRRALVQKAYNQGMRAAAAWADSEGGKSDIKDADLPTTPLKPHEHAAAAKKIHTLLTNPQGASNASALDSYMQGKLNPLASQVIKRCLPDGLAVPFPYNTFSLMCSTGAKGSIVNQSQVSCGLGQQALEGRRVPRMSSGRTLPSFKPYDPNPRADGFITDRFLTGIRPQEYYFHCMSGREGLVDTAVKTSRSGYLQRCLVKHLEELTVAYDNTVRDAEGNVIQFLYGEDGVDPTKAAHLDCKSSTLQYMARNAEALEARYVKVPKPSLAKALEDARDAAASSKSLSKGAVVQARKPRSESSYKKGCDLLDGFFEATVKKVHSDGSVDVAFKDDKSKVKGLPSSFVKRFVRDPILNDASRSKHRIGVSGSCVSERVAKAVSDALEKDDPELRAAMNSSGVDAEKMGSLVARKYADALIAPGEAVGSIAAQSVGEPSTQMTLNTFHLAGHGGANVTLGIPRVREIIMTASRALKTPLMSVPFVPNMKEPQMNKAARSFTKLRLQELLHHEGGVTVHESIKQGMGEWKRAYEVVLHLQPEERIKEAFGLSYDKIAERVGDVFLSRLGALMKAELSRARLHDGETGETGIDIPVGGSRTLKKMAKPKKGDDGDEENNDLSAEERKMAADAKKKKDKKRQKDSEEYDNEEADEEDGVMGSRFGHRAEMATYEDDSSDEEEGAKSSNSDELEPEYEEAMVAGVTINRRNGSLILDSIEVDVSTRPLLMVDLALKATENVIIKSRPAIETGMVVEQEGRGKCLQTEGVNFEELWQLGDDVVDHCRIKSNDIWGIRCAYGVEAARQSIVNEIRGVFGVYGIDVDARHLMLIADYMTHDGDYKPMNRRGMMDGSSAFLKMSFETTATFMTEAAMKGEVETLKSPSANIVLGNPVKAGTGAMDLIVKV